VTPVSDPNADPTGRGAPAATNLPPQVSGLEHAAPVSCNQEVRASIMSSRESWQDPEHARNGRARTNHVGWRKPRLSASSGSAASSFLAEARWRVSRQGARGGQAALETPEFVCYRPGRTAAGIRSGVCSAELLIVSPPNDPRFRAGWWC
jgi:hypothetical protein